MLISKHCVPFLSVAVCTSGHSYLLLFFYLMQLCIVQVTHDISHLTCADVFRAPGVQTPVITRFSTVIHERGSPETLRDPRGFAVKFYTREGNWDLVGNNMPVFFIRDGIKFPDMIHALKPNPKNHLQEDWRIADFFSHVPEAMHMVRAA